MTTPCTCDPSGLVAVPGEALRELAEAMDGLMEGIARSQDDVSEQIAAGAAPDYDGAYHLVWCRAMRAVIMTDPLIRVGASLRRLGDRRPSPQPAGATAGTETSR